MILVLERFSDRFELEKPIVVCDSGLLTKNNIDSLLAKGYKYILGARIKNESEVIKKQIENFDFKGGQILQIKKRDNTKLIIDYSDKRANKDKFNRDIKWDGLKGYITNTELPHREVIESYKNLWKIEKAFRISKNDLKIRPVYHRLKNRIEAHICISFVAYLLFKEFERVLKKHNSNISVQKAIEQLNKIYEVVILKNNNIKRTFKLKNNDTQQKIIDIIKYEF